MNEEDSKRDRAYSSVEDVIHWQSDQQEEGLLTVYIE